MPLSYYLKNPTHSYICMHIFVCIFLIDSHTHLYCSPQNVGNHWIAWHQPCCVGLHHWASILYFLKEGNCYLQLILVRSSIQANGRIHWVVEFRTDKNGFRFWPTGFVIMWLGTNYLNTMLPLLQLLEEFFPLWFTGCLKEMPTQPLLSI